MSLAKAVSILIALEAEVVADEILEANEGFDGEITAEELAIRVCKYMAEHKWSRRGRAEVSRITKPTPKAAPKARALRAGASLEPKKTTHGKVCKHCGQDGLSWTRNAGRWQLLNAETGEAHRCLTRPTGERISRQHWDGLIASLQALKDKGTSRKDAPYCLVYDAEEDAAPASVIDKAVARVYGPEAAPAAPAKPETFIEELKKV